jgi:hypothetical protein
MLDEEFDFLSGRRVRCYNSVCLVEPREQETGVQHSMCDEHTGHNSNIFEGLASPVSDAKRTSERVAGVWMRLKP